MATLLYVVQNERYASSDVSLLISFARVYIVSVNSPFLESHRHRKIITCALNIMVDAVDTIIYTYVYIISKCRCIVCFNHYTGYT